MVHSSVPVSIYHVPRVEVLECPSSENTGLDPGLRHHVHSSPRLPMPSYRLPWTWSDASTGRQSFRKRSPRDILGASFTQTPGRRLLYGSFSSFPYTVRLSRVHVPVSVRHHSGLSTRPRHTDLNPRPSPSHSLPLRSGQTRGPHRVCSDSGRLTSFASLPLKGSPLSPDPSPPRPHSHGRSFSSQPPHSDSFSSHITLPGRKRATPSDQLGCGGRKGATG